MKAAPWNRWGITTRHLVIMSMPVLALFVALVPYSYISQYSDAENSLRERGEQFATLLAQTSEYGVISGNLAMVEATARNLMKADESVVSVEIFSAEREKILTVNGAMTASTDQRQYSAPIRRELISVDRYDDATPGASASSGGVVGYVRVSVARTQMLRALKNRTLVGIAFAVVAMLLSLFLGGVLALRTTRPLAATVGTIRRIKQGDLAATVEVTATGEIGELQSALREMLSSLREVKDNLEQKVTDRTIDLQRARDLAIESGLEKKRLIQIANNAVEDERKAIASEIHDHLNAELIVARLAAYRILDCLPYHTLEPFVIEVRHRSESIIETIDRLYSLSRSLLKRLRPEIIDTLGLTGAIEEMVGQFNELGRGCRFSFWTAGDSAIAEIPNELAMVGYRLIQEALSNVVKHSQASNASVTIVADFDTVSLVIRDDGTGFDTNHSSSGIGLIGMRERVSGVGGTIEVESKVGSGTTVKICLPIHPSASVDKGTAS